MKKAKLVDIITTIKVQEQLKNHWMQIPAMNDSNTLTIGASFQKGN
jgi:hypothetical protein